MTNPPPPENWEDLIAGYVLSDLSPEEVAAVQRLLEEHPELVGETERFQQATRLLALSGSPAKAPSHLRAKVLASANRSVPIPSQTSPNRQLSRWVSFSHLSIGFASTLAASLVVFLGWDNYHLRQELGESQRTLREVRKELLNSQTILATLPRAIAGVFPLQGTKIASTASGNATFTAKNLNITIALQGLPALPEQKIYRLWALVEDSPTPIFCGQFKPNSQGEVTRSWRTPSRIANSNISEVFVTAELVKSPRSPQGQIILQQPL
ncbi:hypothetical protein BST81_05175 [Leptolyngbya sp. 'hensonii']|uniref:anti-sigma factor domain-containing protein n=1 Tax=Leptolyngbya sp. 'hensonii' TaxID=1922337 RepID=UPI00094FE083|nr:anti-sigma factor [Leptolyngbya sp. 'hensonii']OLP19519.1 hypothetical protein BST81_05175 [Leptolyngbya sp. 'hensonii']